MAKKAKKKGGKKKQGRGEFRAACVGVRPAETRIVSPFTVSKKLARPYFKTGLKDAAKTIDNVYEEPPVSLVLLACPQP